MARRTTCSTSKRKAKLMPMTFREKLAAYLIHARGEVRKRPITFMLAGLFVGFIVGEIL